MIQRDHVIHELIDGDLGALVRGPWLSFLYGGLARRKPGENLRDRHARDLAVGGGILPNIKSASPIRDVCAVGLSSISPSILLARYG